MGRATLVALLAAAATGCISQTKFDYVSASVQTIESEMERQKALRERYATNRDETSYEASVYEAGGVVVCKPGTQAIYIEQAELAGDSICTPQDVYAKYDAPTGMLMGQTLRPQPPRCVPISEIATIGVPRRGTTIGYFPFTQEQAECPS